MGVGFWGWKGNAVEGVDSLGSGRDMGLRR